MTASELMNRLNSDPEWVRRQQERESARKAMESQLTAEEAPILADLANAGYSVNSVWDFVNTKLSYPTAIPVLCKHLKLPYHPKIREGIARALTVKEARGIAGYEVLDELKRRANESPDEARWMLANALTVIADASMIDDIKRLLEDSRYTPERGVLRRALKKASAKQRRCKPA